MAEAGQLGMGHDGDNGRLFARRQLSDGLYIPPVFIAKGRVIQQIRDGEQTF